MARATSLLTFPWSSPTRFKLIVNMKTAKALELVIPQLLLHTRWVVLLLTGRWSVSDEKLEGQRSLPQFKAAPATSEGRAAHPRARYRSLTTHKTAGRRLLSLSCVKKPRNAVISAVGISVPSRSSLTQHAAGY